MLASGKRRAESNKACFMAAGLTEFGPAGAALQTTQDALKDISNIR